ncbi:hypothetical protein B0O99DRAFT_218345 [Bisporella sp. PMI_857]|nr:hypothetical protein B0O99DRAFT_218345 [Bisporella sp. PMI_857]
MFMCICLSVCFCLLSVLSGNKLLCRWQSRHELLVSIKRTRFQPLNLLFLTSFATSLITLSSFSVYFICSSWKDFVTTATVLACLESAPRLTRIISSRVQSRQHSRNDKARLFLPAQRGSSARFWSLGYQLCCFTRPLTYSSNFPHICTPQYFALLNSWANTLKICSTSTQSLTSYYRVHAYTAFSFNHGYVIIKKCGKGTTFLSIFS